MLRFCPLNLAKVPGRLHWTETKSFNTDRTRQKILHSLKETQRLIPRISPAVKNLPHFSTTFYSATLLQKIIKLYTICADAICVLGISCYWLPLDTFELRIN